MSDSLAVLHDGRARALTARPRAEAFLHQLSGRPLFACAAVFAAFFGGFSHDQILARIEVVVGGL